MIRRAPLAAGKAVVSLADKSWWATDGFTQFTLDDN